MSKVEWEKLGKKVVMTIIVSLSSNVLFNIPMEKTMEGLWDHLFDMYEKASTSNKVFIIKNMQFKGEGSFVSNHYN